MAIALASSQSNGSTAGTTITVAKPTSTASGDLLIAHLVVQSATASWTGLDGFTSIAEVQGSGMASRICYKVADGTEPDPFTFTVSAAGSGLAKLATVSRITGARRNTSLVISANSGQANASSTTVTATTVTPVEANSLLMFFACNGDSKTHSGYAIATSNPSWTEIIEGTQSTLSFASAYALRPEITATGSGTASLSAAAANIGQMIVVSEMPTTTISDTVTTNDTFLGNIGMFVSDIIAVTDTMTSSIARFWTKLTRNIKTWTNQNKD